MPKEITDPDELLKLSENAIEARIKRLKDFVKIKIRTPTYLYVMKAEPDVAEEIIKRVRCEIVEV
ncbi:MAG: 50S ribosomal protein L38e [Promethearchaeota archaeon]